MRHDEIAGVFLTWNRAEARIGKVERFVVVEMYASRSDECDAHFVQRFGVFRPVMWAQRREVIT